MNIDLGPAFLRAQTVVNGLVTAIPSILVALIVFGGFDLPFPTRRILFHDQTEDSDGDRGRQREGWPAGRADMPAFRKVADAIAQLSRSRPRGVDGE